MVCLSVCLCVDAYSGTTDYEGLSLVMAAFGRHGVKTSDMIMSIRLPRRPLARCFDDRGF